MLILYPLLILASSIFFALPPFAPLDPTLLFFTYIIPLIPFSLVFDGVVSALRTRTGDEILRLIYGEGVKFGMGNKVYGYAPAPAPAREKEGEGGEGRKRKWMFERRYQMHSWPLGWMNTFGGRRLE